MSDGDTEEFEVTVATHVDCQTPPGQAIVVLLVQTGAGVHYFAIDPPLAGALSKALEEAASEARANAKPLS